MIRAGKDSGTLPSKQLRHILEEKLIMKIQKSTDTRMYTALPIRIRYTKLRRRPIPSWAQTTIYSRMPERSSEVIRQGHRAAERRRRLVPIIPMLCWHSCALKAGILKARLRNLSSTPPLTHHPIAWAAAIY